MSFCAVPLILLIHANLVCPPALAQTTDPMVRTAAKPTAPVKVHQSFESMDLHEYFQVNAATISNASEKNSGKAIRVPKPTRPSGFNLPYNAPSLNSAKSGRETASLPPAIPDRFDQFQDLPTIEIGDVGDLGDEVAQPLAPNDRSPNDRSPNDRSPDDRSPNDRSPDDRSPDDRLMALRIAQLKPDQNNRSVDGPTSQNGSSDSAHGTSQFNASIFYAWWLKQLNQNTANEIKISVDQIVLSMLQNSPEIRAISQEPVIASTFIDQESAKFDPVSFLESRWDDTNEPVGNILTTNSSPFLKEHIVDARAGFRKKNRIGTELDLSQSIGFKNSNSDFFQPQDQGTARLELNINQPILNGAGRVVGTSRILLAQIDNKVAWNQYAKRLQDKILTAIKAYWELHFQKSAYVLHQKNYLAAEKLLRRLKGRQSFDTQRSQIIRAEAALAARKLDLVRSLTDIQNAETMIREITRDSSLGRLGILNQRQLAPAENPVIDARLYPDLPHVVTVAYDNRPEIQEAVNRLKAAGVQNNVAKNQLLPQLSLLLNVYSAALNGETGIESALQRQLTASTPGYSAGFIFEYPLYNRSAIARKHRVEAEINKLSSELDDIFGSVTAEVEIAFRELKMAAESLRQAEASIIAAQKDQAFIQRRWENFAFLENPDFSSPTILIEQLLDAQDRITEVEIQYADASRKFMVAAAELRRAEGSLLNYREMKGEDLASAAIYGKGNANPSSSFSTSNSAGFNDWNKVENGVDAPNADLLENK